MNAGSDRQDSQRSRKRPAERSMLGVGVEPRPGRWACWVGFSPMRSGKASAPTILCRGIERPAEGGARHLSMDYYRVLGAAL